MLKSLLDPKALLVNYKRRSVQVIVESVGICIRLYPKYTKECGKMPNLRAGLFIFFDPEECKKCEEAKKTEQPVIACRYTNEAQKTKETEKSQILLFHTIILPKMGMVRNP
jgi:hypothetical protein